MSPDSAAILAINSGSSTLKFGLFAQRNGGEQALLSGGAEGIGKDAGKLEIVDGGGKVLHSESQQHSSQQEALAHIADSIGKLGYAQPTAVGHRIVHGGPKLRRHIRITPDVLRTLEAAVHFAPLHIPTSLDLIRGAEAIYPRLPQFACFDTAFHQTLPEEAYHYPLPEKYLQEGLRRYGFHGLSYASIVHQLGSQLKPRTIAAHLGSGSSLAALRDGQSIDTSMGLTPTGGIPMGTRTGDLDPGVLLYLLRTQNLTTDALESLLNHDSGLRALGGTSDMRELQKAEAGADHRAKLAIEIFSIAIAKTVAEFAVSLGGLDQLVFAGGIGEHSPQIRERVCARLGLLGIKLDEAANTASSPVLSAPGRGIEVRIVKAEEESQMAREIRRLL